MYEEGREEMSGEDVVEESEGNVRREEIGF